MLSSQAKAEIMSRLGAKVGYPLIEGNMTPDIRRGVSTLASVERTLSVMQEISRGEKSRIDGSAILSLTSKVRHKRDDPKLKEQIARLQQEIESKLTDMSTRILKGESLKASENSSKLTNQTGNPVVELKCTKCGAPLPFPTSQFVKCSFCGESLLIQDFTPQLSSIVNGI